MGRRTWIVLVAAGALTLVACSKGGGGAKHSGGADGLKGLFQKMLDATKKGDVATVGKIVQSMMPTKDDYSAVAKPEWAAKISARFVARAERMKALDAEKAARAFRLKPDRTRIDVYKVTTEDLVTYAKGSMAWKKFAGGNRRVAQKALKPGKEFYAVEMRAPGKKYGTKYQLFSFVNGHWALLGKMWRAVPR